MSIETRLNAINDHLVDDYSVLTLAGADLTNVDKNIVNLKPTWKERLLYFINNGTDIVWDNWGKVVGEGTDLTLSNTEQAPMKVLLKGNTYQEGTPTPESPQEVHVVSGDNTVEVVGKNLLNADTNTITNPANENTVTNVGVVELKAGVTYYISYNVENATTSNTRNTPRLKVQADTTYYYQYIGANYNLTTGRKVWTFQCERTAIYELSYWCHTPNVAVTVDNFMVSTSSDTTYEPYQGTTYPINLPEGMFLGSIGDYKDRFFKAIEGDSVYDSLDSATKQTLDSNEWYLEKKIGKVVLDGTESWALGETNTNTMRFVCNNLINSFSSSTTNYYTNYFQKVTQATQGTDDSENLCIRNDLSGIGIRTSISRVTNLVGFKSWLGVHNTQVYYILRNSTYTKIEGTLASQLEEVYRAKSEEGQTNISQTNTDLPFELSVSALSQEV